MEISEEERKFLRKNELVGVTQRPHFMIFICSIPMIVGLVFNGMTTYREFLEYGWWYSSVQSAVMVLLPMLFICFLATFGYWSCKSLRMEMDGIKYRTYFAYRRFKFNDIIRWRMRYFYSYRWIVINTHKGRYVIDATRFDDDWLILNLYFMDIHQRAVEETDYPELIKELQRGDRKHRYHVFDKGSGEFSFT